MIHVQCAVADHASVDSVLEEKTAVAELSRSLGLDLLAPAARDVEASGIVPDRVLRPLLDSGLVVPVPEDLGGGGVPDSHTQMIALENLAYGDGGIALTVRWLGAAAVVLMRCGSAEQRRQGADLVAARSTGSVGLFEGFGRPPSEYRCTITRAADGRVRVKGRKVGVAFAETADPLVIVGVDPQTHELVSVIVPAGMAGVQVSPDRGVLALAAARTGSIEFDVTVPADNLVGGHGCTGGQLTTEVARLRLVLAATQVGTAQRAVDYAAEYAGQRIAFGKPIASFQGVSFPLAEAQIQIQQARLEIADAALALDAGDEAPADDLESMMNQAVSCANEVAVEATRTALQTLGGHGFITDHPVELWYRTAAALSAFDHDPLLASFRPAL